MYRYAPLQMPTEWYSVSQLASLNLPGLPNDKRTLKRLIVREGWASRADRMEIRLVRPRAGRGGGLEYHVGLLPAEARLEIWRRSGFETNDDELGPSDTAAIWRWFYKRPPNAQERAKERLAILNEVLVLEANGCTRTAALAKIARDHGISTGKIWNLLALVRGWPRRDWLAALAPRSKGEGRKAQIDPRLLKTFVIESLQSDLPSLSKCYKTTKSAAKELGLALPTERTFHRRLEGGIDLIALRRDLQGVATSA
jgi:putative transposase